MSLAVRSAGEALPAALSRLAATDARLAAVGCRNGIGRETAFSEARPDAFFDVGAEQNLVLTAAGLALGGRNVYAAANAALLAGRGYDQIRAAVAAPSLPVKLVGLEAGLSAGPEGAYRQMLEDVALMRALPGVTVLVPADYTSALALLERAASSQGPVYLRLGGASAEDIYEEGDDAFFPGGGRVLREGSGVTVCCCGIMVREALRAAEVLARQNISAEVIDCYSVAPLPARVILDSVHRTGCCVTAEEHLAGGGLGEAVAALTGDSYPVPVKPVAVFDKFGQSGAPQELREYYGLTASQIVSEAMQVWIMRRR